MDVRFSITLRMHKGVRRLIEGIPEDAWTSIPCWIDGGADVAEITYTPFADRRHFALARERDPRSQVLGIGVNDLPSGKFAANGARLAVQLMVNNLARWTGKLGLGSAWAWVTPRPGFGLVREDTA